MVNQLRKRFVLVAMLSILVVMTLIVLGITGVNRYQMTQQADELLQLIHDEPQRFIDHEPIGPWGEGQGGMGPMPGENMNGGMIPGGGRFDEETTFRTRFFMLTYDANGQLFSSNLQSIAAVTQEEASAYGAQVLASNSTKGSVDDYRYLKDVQDNQTVIYCLNRSLERENVRTYLLGAVLVGVISYGLLFILISFVSGRAVRPLTENIERQKQFITDAGHELKTPISIISANAEVLEMENGTSPWLSNIQDQVKRMTELVKRLLALSRMDEAQVQGRFSRVPFSELTEETAMDFVPVAEGQGKTMTVHVDKGLELLGEKDALKELVSILCDNAVKYCDDKGAIDVALTAEGKKVKLTVQNAYETGAPVDTNKLFDRFYRSDTSRNQKSGGYGIGLSIAKAVVDVHKGKIHATHENGKMVFEAIL